MSQPVQSRRFRFLRSALFGVLLALPMHSACLDRAPVTNAPEDLDGLVHWFWANSASATDSQLADAAQKLDVAAGGVDRTLSTAPTKGALTRLAVEELASVGLQDARNPAAARGMLLVNVFPCTLERLEPILYDVDQNAIYSSYDSYSRRYTSDLDAYRARTSTTLSWDSEIEATMVTSKYRESPKGDLRRLAPSAKVASAVGPVLVTRTWLPEPATFEVKDLTWQQDYQIEVFYENTPGHVVHVYGMWREMKLRAYGLTTEDDELANLTLSSLVDWDKTTAKHCAMR
jgi:hypothetical protein